MVFFILAGLSGEPVSIFIVLSYFLVSGFLKEILYYGECLLLILDWFFVGNVDVDISGLVLTIYITRLFLTGHKHWG